MVYNFDRDFGDEQDPEKKKKSRGRYRSFPGDKVRLGSTQEAFEAIDDASQEYLGEDGIFGPQALGGQMSMAKEVIGRPEDIVLMAPRAIEHGVKGVGAFAYGAMQAARLSRYNSLIERYGDDIEAAKQGEQSVRGATPGSVQQGGASEFIVKNDDGTERFMTRKEVLHDQDSWLYNYAVNPENAGATATAALANSVRWLATWGDQGFGPNASYKTPARPEAPVAAMAQTIVDFAAPFVGALGKLKYVPRYSPQASLFNNRSVLGIGERILLRGKNYSKIMAAGAVADATFNPYEGRLTDFLLELGVPENEWTEWLKADMNDTVLSGMLKNALEGAALGPIFDATFSILSKLSRATHRWVNGVDKKFGFDNKGQKFDITDEINILAEKASGFKYDEWLALVTLKNATGLDLSKVGVDVDNALFRSRRGDKALAQAEADEVKGYTEYDVDARGNIGKVFINLLEQGDISTFIHEMGHALRLTVFENPDAKIMLPDDPSGPKYLSVTPEDIDKVAEACGVTMKDANGNWIWSTESEEIFARALESYMYKGDTPTSGLGKSFKIISSVMREIYGGVKEGMGDLGAWPKSHELGLDSIFDKMFKRGDVEDINSNRLINEGSSPTPDVDSQGNVLFQGKFNMGKYSGKFVKENADKTLIRKTNDQVPLELNEGNYGRVLPVIAKGKDKVDFDPLSSVESYDRALNIYIGQDSAPTAPKVLIDDLTKNNGKGAVEKLKNLSFEQRAAVEDGLALTKEVGKNLKNPTDLARLLYWSKLSAGITPFTQEAAFLDSLDEMDRFINLARDGKFDLEEYFAWGDGKFKKAEKGQASERVGTGTKHNYNSFGRDFLTKVNEAAKNGEDILSKVYKSWFAKNRSSNKVVMDFAKIFKGASVGLDNKLLNFARLVSGFHDSVILDRIQIENWYGVPNGKATEGYAKSLNGPIGMVQYDLLNTALPAKVKNVYDQLGRNQDDATVGRFHWETWIANQQSQVNHETLRTFIQGTEYSQGIRETRYDSSNYGVIYGAGEPGNSNRGVMIHMDGGQQLAETTAKEWEEVKKYFKESTNGTPRKLDDGKAWGLKYISDKTRPWIENEEIYEEGLQLLAILKGNKLRQATDKGFDKYTKRLNPGHIAHVQGRWREWTVFSTIARLRDKVSRGKGNSFVRGVGGLSSNIAELRKSKKAFYTPSDWVAQKNKNGSPKVNNLFAPNKAAVKEGDYILAHNIAELSSERAAAVMHFTKNRNEFFDDRVSESFEGARLFVSESGKSGIAVKDGKGYGLFLDPSERDVSHSLLRVAIEHGGMNSGYIANKAAHNGFWAKLSAHGAVTVKTDIFGVEYKINPDHKGFDYTPGKLQQRFLPNYLPQKKGQAPKSSVVKHSPKYHGIHKVVKYRSEPRQWFYMLPKKLEEYIKTNQGNMKLAQVKKAIKGVKEAEWEFSGMNFLMEQNPDVTIKEASEKYRPVELEEKIYGGSTNTDEKGQTIDLYRVLTRLINDQIEHREAGALAYEVSEKLRGPHGSIKKYDVHEIVTKFMKRLQDEPNITRYNSQLIDKGDGQADDIAEEAYRLYLVHSGMGDTTRYGDVERGAEPYSGIDGIKDDLSNFSRKHIRDPLSEEAEQLMPEDARGLAEIYDYTQSERMYPRADEQWQANIPQEAKRYRDTFNYRVLTLNWKGANDYIDSSISESDLVALGHHEDNAKKIISDIRTLKDQQNIDKKRHYKGVRHHHGFGANNLFHVRFGDTYVDGIGRVLTVFEVQSDWGLAARQQGYLPRKFARGGNYLTELGMDKKFFDEVEKFLPLNDYEYIEGAPKRPLYDILFHEDLTKQSNNDLISVIHAYDSQHEISARANKVEEIENRMMQDWTILKGVLEEMRDSIYRGFDSVEDIGFFLARIDEEDPRVMSSRFKPVQGDNADLFDERLDTTLVKDIKTGETTDWSSLMDFAQVYMAATANHTFKESKDAISDFEGFFFNHVRDNIASQPYQTMLLDDFNLKPGIGTDSLDKMGNLTEEASNMLRGTVFEEHPLMKNWVEHAVQRMFKVAADEGYDAISFFPPRPASEVTGLSLDKAKSQYGIRVPKAALKFARKVGVKSVPFDKGHGGRLKTLDSSEPDRVIRRYMGYSGVHDLTENNGLNYLFLTEEASHHMYDESDLKFVSEEMRHGRLMADGTVADPSEVGDYGVMAKNHMGANRFQVGTSHGPNTQRIHLSKVLSGEEDELTLNINGIVGDAEYEYFKNLEHPNKSAGSESGDVYKYNIKLTKEDTDLLLLAHFGVDRDKLTAFFKEFKHSEDSESNIWNRISEELDDINNFMESALYSLQRYVAKETMRGEGPNANRFYSRGWTKKVFDKGKSKLTDENSVLRLFFGSDSEFGKGTMEAFTKRLSEVSKGDGLDQDYAYILNEEGYKKMMRGEHGEGYGVVGTRENPKVRSAPNEQRRAYFEYAESFRTPDKVEYGETLIEPRSGFRGMRGEISERTDIQRRVSAPSPLYQQKGHTPYKHLEDAVRDRTMDKITQKEFNDVVSDLKPIRPYAFVPKPATTSEMEAALNKRQVKDVESEIVSGSNVELRLDIPAYTRNNTWIPAVHYKSQGSRKTSYHGAVVVNNAVLPDQGNKAARVGMGDKAKSPFAVIKGTYETVEPKAIYDEAKEALASSLNPKDNTWTQVGFDPKRHSYFYDRQTQEVVESAERVIQVGPLVLAKNAKKYNFDDRKNAPEVLYQASNSRPKMPTPAEDPNMAGVNPNNVSDDDSLNNFYAGTMRSFDGEAQHEHLSIEQQQAKISEEYQIMMDDLGMDMDDKDLVKMLSMKGATLQKSLNEVGAMRSMLLDVSGNFKEFVEANTNNKGEFIGNASLLLEAMRRRQTLYEVSSLVRENMGRVARTLGSFRFAAVDEGFAKRASGETPDMDDRWIPKIEDHEQALQYINAEFGGVENARLSLMQDYIYLQFNPMATTPKTKKFGFAPAIMEYWMNNILSGFQSTHTANLVGGFGAGVLRRLERSLGALLQADVSLAKSELKELKYYFAASLDAFKIASYALKEGRPKLVDDLGTIEGKAGHNQLSAFGASHYMPNPLKPNITKDGKGIGALGKTYDYIGNFINVPSRMLMSEDEFMRQMNYRSRMRRRIYDIADQRFGENPKSSEVQMRKEDFIAKQWEMVGSSGEQYSIDSVRSKLALKAKSQNLEPGTKEYSDFMRNNVRAYYDKDVMRANAEAVRVAEENTFTNQLDSNASSKGIFNIGNASKNVNDQGILNSQYSENAFGESNSGFLTQYNPLSRTNVARISNAMSGLSNEHAVIKFIFPFIKTPTNILQMYLDRTTGFASDSLRLLADKEARKAYSKEDRAELVGRGATGITLMMHAYGLASQETDDGLPLITGSGPIDKNQQKVWKSLGIQEYSIYKNGKYYSYKKLDPFAIFYGLMADIVQIKEYQEAFGGKPELMKGLFVALTNNLIHKSYLSGMFNASKALSDPYEYGEQFLQRMSSGFVPYSGMVGQLPGQDYLKQIRSIGDAMAERWLLSRNDLQDKYDMFGDPVKKSQVGMYPFNQNWVGPMSFKEVSDDPVKMEMYRIQSNQSTPSIRQQGLDWTEYKYKGKTTAYDRMMYHLGTIKLINPQTGRSETLKEKLNWKITQPDYRMLSEMGLDDLESPRDAKLGEIFSEYLKAAREKTRSEIPQLDMDIRVKEKTESYLKGDPSYGNMPMGPEQAKERAIQDLKMLYGSGI